MLLRVDVSTLRPGVFIDSVDGGWLSSPFWRKRFLMEDAADIERLRGAGIATVTIDTARGLGPIEPGSVSADIIDDRITAVADADLPAANTSPRRRIRTVAPSEIDVATETVQRSKEAVTAMFGEARMGRAIEIAAVEPLVDDIAASVARDPSAMVKVTRLKTKNEYTYLHSVAVCALMINLARHIGLDEGDIRTIGMAGLLHDIGKMAIPEEVLEKPGRLTDDEVAIVRAHPEQGHQMLIDCPHVSGIALDVCLHHHERIDGGGYPFGLHGGELSIHARMAAICDVYDAVTSNRPYKRAWSANDALARMLEWGGHFDTELLAAFIASLAIHPTGGLIRLGSNRLGLVTHGNYDEPTAPAVRAFYSIPAAAFLPPEDTTIGGSQAAERIVRAEAGAYWFGESWDEVKAAVIAGKMPSITGHTPTRPYAITQRRTYTGAILNTAAIPAAAAR